MYKTILPDDLRLSNTTGILQNMEICMICILSSLHHIISSHYIIRDLKQRRRQQQRQKKITLTSKTTALHVLHAF